MSENTTMTTTATLQLHLLDRSWCNQNAPTVLTSMRGKQFTADDLHGVLPDPENVNLFGVLVASLSSRKLIRRVGSRPSTRTPANGRWVGVYEVVEGAI